MYKWYEVVEIERFVGEDMYAHWHCTAPSVS